MAFFPTRIIWHHSADETQKPQFDKINAYHKSKGFPVSSLGFFVGYHWLIEPNGDVIQARSEDEIGAHDTGENLNSLGICLAGDFDYAIPTEAQCVSLASLMDGIRSRHKIGILSIEPHRRDDNTSCPGWALPDKWFVKEYLKRSAVKYLNIVNLIDDFVNFL
jgi:N-acetylmuramoyl-L-alanine amidase